MSFPLNELQVKLAYKFENIQLLHEALTHDFDLADTKWDIFDDGNVFYKKRKLHRLKCIGVSILKLLMAEKAVIIHHGEKVKWFSNEGNLTEIRKRFNERCSFDAVGRHLKIWNFIHSRNCVDVKTPSIIKEVIQAIFGAVFIDEGGCESKNSCAMQSVRKLFDLLINKYDFYLYSYPDTRKLYDCFSVKYFDLRDFLIAKRYALKIKSYKSLEKRLKYRFEDPDLIKTALTHDSVKNFIPDVSHYEVLEFLGDAVYELVMCEYFFWHYINDRDGKVFNCGTLTKFVSKNFQHAIAKGFDLEQYIIKPDHVQVNDIHDFLESVIAAIYIDSKSLKPAKTVLVELCRQFEKDTVESCNIRLPFTLRTYYASSYYIPISKLRRVKEEHNWPPKPQDTFEIKNLAKLKSRLGNYYKHNESLETIQSYNSNAKLLGSESWCNQQEFGRISLFETMMRIQYLDEKVYLYDTAKILLRFHTYDMHPTEYPQVIPESATPGLSCVEESTQGYIFIRNEPTLGDVFHVFSLWIRKRMPTSIKMGCKMVKQAIDFIFGLVLLGFYIWLFTILNWPLRCVLVIFTIIVGLYDNFVNQERS